MLRPAAAQPVDRGLWPARYFTDFDTTGDFWMSGSIPSLGEITDGVFRSPSPWMDDDNHLLAGLIQHVMMRHQVGFEEKVAGEITNPVVFTNAVMTLRFRGIDYKPQQSRAMPWVQSRFPGGANRFSNFGLKAVDFSAELADGQWHERMISLPSDPDSWVFGGAPGQRDESGIYAFQPIDAALQHVSNFFPIMAVRPVGTPPPSGIVEVDWIEILHLRKTPPQPPRRPQLPPPGNPLMPAAMYGATTDGVTIVATGPAVGPGWRIGQGVQWDSPYGGITVQLPGPVVPTRYELRALNNPMRAPRSWSFDGWTGRRWVSLDVQVDVRPWGGGESRSYEVEHRSRGYDRLRLQITDSQDDRFLQWRGLQIWH
jgi:hypothetical protein